MTKITPQNYFDDTTAISNSLLRTFVSYDKYGSRIITDQKFHAQKISKKLDFIASDAVIIGKIVDRYFDSDGEDVWKYYIPVSKRGGKAIQVVVDEQMDREIFYAPCPKTSKIKANFAEGEEAGYGDSNAEAIDNLKEVVTKAVNKDYMEITKGMEADAQLMIEAGLAFHKLQEFLKGKGVEKQMILEKELEIVDKDGVVHKVKIKGLPDFVDTSIKTVVDLKTSGSSSMILESLQFNGKPKLTAPYIRQLAFYNKMLGGGFHGAIALIGDNQDIRWFDIPNILLERAWEQIEIDIIELIEYKADPLGYECPIFDLSKLDEEADELKL